MEDKAMSRTKWDYTVHVYTVLREIGPGLRAASEEGWEVVGFAVNADGKYVVLLKRPAT